MQTYTEKLFVYENKFYSLLDSKSVLHVYGLGARMQKHDG
jgi:hypothetical protein